MYRRYTQVNESGVSMAQIKRSRIKDLVILLLLLALAASLVVGIPAYLKEGSLRGEYIRQVQKECDEAIRLTSVLSRNAAADSAAQLAKIRSSIYAIRNMNSLYAARSGETLVAEDRLLTLQNTVDNFLSELTKGMDTGGNQTNLQNALEELQAVVSGLN